MAPEVMHRLGDCGGPVPGGLHLLRILARQDGEDDPNVVFSCPVADANKDEDVPHWMDLVSSPRGRGLLEGLTELDLPPLYRALRDLAAGWFGAWRSLQVPHA